MKRQQGFTLVELTIVAAVIATIAAIAIPNFLSARRVANEGSAISFLRILTTVNEQYRTRFRSYAGSLTDLASANYIDAVFGAGSKSGYNFSYTPGSFTWSCGADPQVPGETGNRYFFNDESGVIRFSTTGAATSSDAPIE